MASLIDHLEAELNSALTKWADSFYLKRELNKLIIFGRLNITGPDSSIIDGFNIEIEIPQDFPKRVPLVREVGGRVPRKPERHINDDGSACLFIPMEKAKWFPTEKMTNPEILRNFINVPVYWYFVGQLAFEKAGKWPWPEWDHGALGIYDFFAERYNLPNNLTDRWKKYFVRMLLAKKLKQNWKCFCGTYKALRECHGPQIVELRQAQIVINSLRSR